MSNTNALLAVEQFATPATLREVRKDDQKAGLELGKSVTGQYLFDMFVVDQSELTKMDIVEMLVNTTDTLSFKNALKDMVSIAEKHSEAKKKTAQNHQSVMRVAYGVMRFLRDKLPQGERIGYREMQKIGAKLLKDNGIKWTGEPVLSDDEKERKHQTVQERQALEQAQKENPRLENESIVDWTLRIAPDVEATLEATKQSERKEKVEALAKKVIALCGDDMIEDVLNFILQSEFETVVKDEEPALM